MCVLDSDKWEAAPSVSSIDIFNPWILEKERERRRVNSVFLRVAVIGRCMSVRFSLFFQHAMCVFSVCAVCLCCMC